MSVCFKLFDISHNFWKAATPILNHMVCRVKPISFKQIKRVNDEEQSLRIFRNLYFKIKCNDNKKDSFEFF